MKEKLQHRRKLFRVYLALLILMGVVLSVTPALAETLNVSGADHYFDETKDSLIDILSVTGNKGDQVYINMTKDDEVIADHLAYTIDSEDAAVDANKDMAGVVSVKFDASVFEGQDSITAHKYSVKVYADRNENELIYEGTITPVYKQFEDDGKTEFLAFRMLAEGEDRPFTAPQTIEHNGIVYDLKSAEPTDINGKQFYLYGRSANVADSTEAHVKYYDNDTKELVKTETVTLAKDSSQEVALEDIIASDADGSIYRTLKLSDSVVVAYPGITEYSIMCKKLNASDWGAIGSFFKATINYTDTEGKNLGVVDSVIVNKDYFYTPPTKLYLNESGTVKEYTLAAANESLNAQGVLELHPGMADSATTFNIVYAPVDENAERYWTVVLENGSVSPKDAGRVINRVTYKGKPGDSAVHTTEAKIQVDGVDYVPTASAEASYSHTFGVADMDVEQTIYYVPDGYVAPEAYDITVKYVNIANNEVIDTRTLTASPSMRADLEVDSPESFTAGGIEWIRLAGQEQPIRHGFYSPAREYVVYYRDVNDDLHANTVIRTLRVVYVDEQGNTVTRPTTVIDNGTTDNGTVVGGTTTTTTTTTGGAATAGTAAGATTTGLQTGTDLLAIDGGEGNSSLVNEGGTDMGTVRIEDEETPLAAAPGKEAAAKVDNTGAIAIGGVAAAAAAGLIIFFVYKRRKQGNDESSNDDLTA